MNTARNRSQDALGILHGVLYGVHAVLAICKRWPVAIILGALSWLFLAGVVALAMHVAANLSNGA